MTTELIKEYGDRLLPYLVQAAKTLKTPTYKELADKIGVHHRVMNRILCYIRDDICGQRDLPLISCMTLRNSRLCVGRVRTHPHGLCSCRNLPGIALPVPPRERLGGSPQSGSGRFLVYAAGSAAALYERNLVQREGNPVALTPATHAG